MSKIASLPENYAEFKKFDEMSRADWAQAAGEVLAAALLPEVLDQIVDDGADKFRFLASRQYAGHGFHDEDFDAMFRMMSDVSARRRKSSAWRSSAPMQIQ